MGITAGTHDAEAFDGSKESALWISYNSGRTFTGKPVNWPKRSLEKQRYELRRDVFLAASDLQQVLESFKHASESLAGFRRDCAVSRMQAVKRHCAELRDDCERVNAQLLGGGWAR